jgi:hypothetical protein
MNIQRFFWRREQNKVTRYQGRFTENKNAYQELPTPERDKKIIQDEQEITVNPEAMKKFHVETMATILSQPPTDFLKSHRIFRRDVGGRNPKNLNKEHIKRMLLYGLENGLENENRIVRNLTPVIENDNSIIGLRYTKTEGGKTKERNMTFKYPSNLLDSSPAGVASDI